MHLIRTHRHMDVQVPLLCFALQVLNLIFAYGRRGVAPLIHGYQQFSTNFALGFQEGFWY